jgi:hypothetical protein
LLILFISNWLGRFWQSVIRRFCCRLLAAVFEYPVFKEDIAPKGVQIVSLRDKIIDAFDGLVQVDDEVIYNAAEEMLAILSSPQKYNQISANNYETSSESKNGLLKFNMRHWCFSTELLA